MPDQPPYFPRGRCLVGPPENSRYRRRAFRQMRLDAPSLYAIVGDWSRMRLVVTDNAATITGDGFTSEIIHAFNILSPGWQATIHLPRRRLSLPRGAYELVWMGKSCFACRHCLQYRLADRAAVIAVGR